MKLIDKSALAAEIENLLESVRQRLERYKNDPFISDIAVYRFGKQLTKILDTLEVKEVNLEKSISDWLSEGLPNDEELIDYIKETAEHFFELGLKAQKGE